LKSELSKTTPKVAHALDAPMDDAGKALSNALKATDKKASNEEVELLKSYRSFLQGQVTIRSLKRDLFPRGVQLASGALRLRLIIRPPE
jgi:hypothetical protein